MHYFVNLYGLPDNETGVISTYYVNHILNIASFYSEETLEKLSDYSEGGTKFHIKYLIDKVVKHVNQLSDAAVSLTRNL